MLSLVKYQCLAACFVVIVCSERNYNENLTKLWSITGSTQTGRARTAVVNVTSASLLIQPSSYGQEVEREPKNYRYPKFYGFKPRSIPIKTEQQQESLDQYEDPNKHKSEVLFPGNYFTIAEVKRQNLSDQTFDPLAPETFTPKAIPLIRSQYQRSLNMDEEPVMENPEEAVASRRSIASYFDDEDEEDDSDDDMDLIGDDEDADVKKHGGHKRKGSKKLSKKYAKYMLPLLIAYKLKYFSMIPVMIGGLVLLVGATGMAGFFFALFAAVMGLQKGSY